MREEVPGQGVMFPVAAPYRRPRRVPTKDSWQAYKGKRTSCDVCVLDLHAGTPDGPLETARTRLVRVTGKVWLLCDRHTSQAKNGGRGLD